MAKQNLYTRTRKSNKIRVQLENNDDLLNTLWVLYKGKHGAYKNKGVIQVRLCKMENSETRQKFGQRLKELRNSKGVNMQYVAERIGVARSTYAGYETQERFPPIETLARLAEVLGTSTDYLIGLTPNQEPKELTRNVDEYLKSMDHLNWNGIPLSNDELKPLRDLFQIVIRERLPKMLEETDTEKDCDQ